MTIPIGIQLYSLKRETAKDFPGTLKALATMGYDGVEFASYGGIAAPTMKAHLDNLGLKVAGSHANITVLTTELNQEIDYNLLLGNRNMVCSWSDCKTEADFLKLAEQLTHVGERLRDVGMTLSYHNHAHEFVDLGGQCGMDILQKHVDPALLSFEIDLYWVKHAELDPLDYVKTLGTRVSMLHCKDMNDEPDQKSTEVGSGLIDFAPIVFHAQTVGTQWLIVEQETFVHYSPMESVRIGLEHLKQISS